MSRAQRVVVLCPGRGSYGRDSLGSLAGISSPALDVFDVWRRGQGLPTPRELDAAPSYASRLHQAGENASILTAAASLADLDQLDPERVRVVAVVGNSMGWYTALGFAGALPLEDCARLVDTMGYWQAPDEHGVVGGQAMTPVVGDDWRPDPGRRADVERVVAEVPDLFWSIRLGGQAVLGGTEAALAEMERRLPKVTWGERAFPMRLPLHSAFHTPLLAATSERAKRELADLRWTTPRVPLVDGTGRVWRPVHGDPLGIRSYTLGAQVVETYDFTASLRVALGEYAPDAVVLPGPGSALGGAVAQVLIGTGWRGLRDRTDFLARQASDSPLLLSMRWPDQRKRIVA